MEIIRSTSGTISRPARIPAGWDGGAKLSEEEAFEIGTEAYIYGYPLVTMEMTRRVMTNVAEARGHARPHGPVLPCATLPRRRVQDVTAPNADTLYSTAWLDLSARSPRSCTCRTRTSRYYLMPMLSGWTDVFQVPGKRTTGDKAQASTPSPARTGRARCPTGVKQLQVADQHGLDPRPHLLHRHAGGLQGRPCDQDQYHLVPLSAYGKPYTPPPGKVDPTIDMKTRRATR